MSTLLWSALGPAPQHNGNIAYSGRAIAFALSADIDGLGTRALFAATDGGGVWRSTNFTTAAPSWQPLSNFVPATVENRTGLSQISSITVDPHDQRVIYAGGGTGILRSSDGGNTWLILPNSPGGAVKIVVDPRPGGVGVWAGASSGLWTSVGGNN